MGAALGTCRKRARIGACDDARSVADRSWQDLSLRQRSDTPALENIDFDIGQGEFLSILGPSGCGKSTLLLLASGLELPTSGKVSLAGKDIDKPVTDIGIVFQTDALLDWRTALGNVMIEARTSAGSTRSSTSARPREPLALVGLAEFEGNYPYQLSGGMRQRVSICRALIQLSATAFDGRAVRRARCPQRGTDGDGVASVSGCEPARA